MVGSRIPGFFVLCAGGIYPTYFAMCAEYPMLDDVGLFLANWNENKECVAAALAS
jgi:hypothetical protein